MSDSETNLDIFDRFLLGNVVIIFFCTPMNSMIQWIELHSKEGANSSYIFYVKYPLKVAAFLSVAISTSFT